MTARYSLPATVLALSMLAACAGTTATSGASAAAPSSAAAAATAANAANAANAAPKPFEYAPSTGQYRFTSSSKMLQSMMGQSQEVTQSSSRVMTIALARSAADTVTMTLTIDSVTATGPMGMPVLGIDKLPGAKFTAKLAPNGSFYSATGPSEAENQYAAAMVDEAGRALPRLKSVLAAGRTWTDTIKDRVKQGPLQLDREIITTFTVRGDTVVSGAAAWKIGRELAIKASGKGTANGQEVTFESTGTGSGMLIMSKAGVLMAGNGEEKSNGTVSMAMGQLTLVGTTNTTFTKVK